MVEWKSAAPFYLCKGDVNWGPCTSDGGGACRLEQGGMLSSLILRKAA